MHELFQYTGLVLSLGLLIWMALRGVNIIVAAVISAAIVAITNDLNLFDALTDQFSAGPVGAFTFAGRFFLLFVTGAVFGRAMADSHAASSIAQALAGRLGAHRALWIVVLATALLTYGGVVVFVVLFAVYPLGMRLIEEAGIPKRLLAAAIGLGAGTFTMTALPGTPSIHNVIAASALGTDLYAGAGLGLIGAALMFGMGMWYLERQRVKCTVTEPGASAHKVAARATVASGPHWAAALLPIAVVLFIILLPRLIGWLSDPAPGSPPARIAELGKAEPIAWPSLALVAGTILCLLMFSNLRRATMTWIGRGTEEGLLPLINTAAVIGFGSVVSQTAGFANFARMVTELDLPPLLSLFTAVNVLAGIVGSASGGLQIFMTTMAPHFTGLGIPVGELHRIATMASGCLDSLPHSGTVVALLMIMKMTHKEGYKDLGMVTVVVPLLATLITIAIALVL
jgi:H+/gluconate symporter-like permease